MTIEPASSWGDLLMPDLTDVLAGLLLRRLRRRRPCEVADDALMAYVQRQQSLVQRLKHSADSRAARDAVRRERYRLLKRRLSAAKDLAKTLGNRVNALETELGVLREQHQRFQEMMIPCPAPQLLGPMLSTQELNGWRRFWRYLPKVWHHSMRLGVLRQHEPQPVQQENLPRSLPPGTQESWPLVSMVTPSFQQARFLERTMRSVMDQDYPRLEYRVVDGGSTDGSVNIVGAHAKRLAGWASQQDNGPASAINRGLAESGGEIMGWLNSDDVLMPGAVRCVANYFARHPEVDVVYGHRVIIDERGWQVGRWVLPPHDGATLLWIDFIPQESLFWRRSAWDKVGGRLDEDFKFAFDWELLLRFQKAGARMVRLPWFLSCFRVHDAQKSAVEMATLGKMEMARLRERELGSLFNLDRFNRRVVLFQARAVWYDRMVRWGIRW